MSSRSATPRKGCFCVKHCLSSTHAFLPACRYAITQIRKDRVLSWCQSLHLHRWELGSFCTCEGALLIKLFVPCGSLTHVRVDRLYDKDKTSFATADIPSCVLYFALWPASPNKAKITLLTPASQFSPALARKSLLACARLSGTARVREPTKQLSLPSKAR